MKATPNGWTKEHIITLLDTSDRAVERALVRIYERQTADEQASLATLHSNGRGFNGSDSRILTDIAKRCIRYNGLKGKQYDLVRRRIRKYWAQLLEIAAEHPKNAPQ